MKWLLTERAALQGNLAKQQGRAAALQQELSRAEHVVQACREQLAAHDARLRDCALRIDALGQAIAMAYPLVEPDSVGPVNAWPGQYGKRGALTRFLRQTIEDAGPAGCTTVQLLHGVQDNFCLSIGTPDEWRAFRLTVRGRLRHLRDKEGVIVSERSGPLHTSIAVWRKKSATSLESLRAQAGAAGAANECDPLPDPV